MFQLQGGGIWVLTSQNAEEQIDLTETSINRFMNFKYNKNNFQNLDGFIEDNDHFYYLKVYFEDTDAGQIVYHTNYLKYFERARTSLLNLLKIDQVELRKKHNIILVVRKADLIWHKPALLNDLLLIKTCLKYAKNSSITINNLLTVLIKWKKK